MKQFPPFLSSPAVHFPKLAPASAIHFSCRLCRVCMKPPPLHSCLAQSLLLKWIFKISLQHYCGLKEQSGGENNLIPNKVSTSKLWYACQWKLWKLLQVLHCCRACCLSGPVWQCLLPLLSLCTSLSLWRVFHAFPLQQWWKYVRDVKGNGSGRRRQPGIKWLWAKAGDLPTLQEDLVGERSG